MNVKLLTKDFFKKRGGEQLDELEDRTKVVSFIKLPKSVNDYMGDKGQTKNFKFSSVNTDIFDDKSGSSGHFAFKFNQPKGMRALDEFYDEMLPPIDYSGELPEYYEYKLNKGKTTNDRIVDKLRENGLDEDATLLPEAQELYPQFKTQKGEAFERFKAQVEKYKAEKIPIIKESPSSTIAESEGGGEGTPHEIEVKPVKKYKPVNKYSKPSAEERQKILRAEKMDKLDNEIQQIHSNESAKSIQKVFRGNKARQQTELIKKEKINKAAVNIQKVLRGREARIKTEQLKKAKNNVSLNEIPPSESSILNEDNDNQLTPSQLVSPLPFTSPQKADKDKSPIPALTEAPKKTKPQESPALIGMQRKSLNDSFTEASEDKDEDFEELEQTPKKSVKELREGFLKKFEDENRARRKENLGMSYADELEKEIEKHSGDKNFKNMKADKDTMRKYNELKEFDIINVKNTVGRKTVKLQTILKNIKISTNLKDLRKAHEEEDNRRNEEREKDKDVRYGAPKTKIQTLESVGRGGGGGEGAKEASASRISKK